MIGKLRMMRAVADDLGRAMSQDDLGCTVGEGHLILNVCRDHATGDGCKYIVHQVLQPGHFFEGVLQRGEQSCIFNRHRGLVGEREQQVAF